MPRLFFAGNYQYMARQIIIRKIENDMEMLNVWCFVVAEVTNLSIRLISRK